ncbi:MAG: hypothetical protein H0U31_06975, partial [Chloroflexia bacterium]|nr:hypothetical protein [Chloroflexia bacterium]
IASSDEAFEGDVLAYVDPSIATIERSVSISTTFVPGVGEPDPQSVANSPRPVPVVGAPAPRTLVEGNLWVAAISVLGLLGVRGLLAFRNVSIRRSPLASRSTRQPAKTVDTAAFDS